MTGRQRILITGGGKRIGAALVKRFAQMGFQVFIHAFQSVSEAEKLRLELSPNGCHQISICDLSDPAARRAWLKSLPPLNVVINNASVYRLTPRGVLESAENRERYWQVNYHAPLEIIEHLRNNPVAGNTLAITLLDSDILTADGGIKEFAEPEPGMDSYLATRIALGHKLLKLAKSYAPDLRLCAIAPGPVLPPVNAPEARMIEILQRVPLRRPSGVDEIANCAEFFWRNLSLTGVILPVDGGMHLNSFQQSANTSSGGA